LNGNDNKPEKMTKEWEDLESKCVNTIRLCITDNIINNVIDEDLASTLWEKLEKLSWKKLNNEVESEAGSIQAEDRGWCKSHGTLKYVQRVAGSTWAS